MIKRVNYIFTIILAILGTILFFQKFNYIYNENIGLLNLNHIKNGESVNVNISLNPGETGHSMTELLDASIDMLEALQQPGYIASSGMSDDGLHNRLNYFMTSHSELLSHINFINDYPIEQLMQESDWHITNNKNSESVLIDFLDASYYEHDTGFKREISMRPLHQVYDYVPDNASQILIE